MSQLFHEHPDLIVGFNAFLPLGYRIDIPKNGKLNVQSPLPSQVGAAPAVHTAGALGLHPLLDRAHQWLLLPGHQSQ